MKKFIENMLLNNLILAQFVENQEIKDWEIYAQDGPSEEILLVSKSNDLGIFYDELFGWSSFPLPVDKLKICGWRKVGNL